MALEGIRARLQHPTWSAGQWYEAYRAARHTMRTVRTEPFDHRTFDRAHDLHVASMWALATFRSRALPYALELMKSSDHEDRATATGILEAAADHPTAFAALVALVTDSDLETRDAAISSLGRMKAPESIGPLADVLRDESEDGDTRDLARIALGQVTSRRFGTVGAALAWLDELDRRAHSAP